MSRTISNYCYSWDLDSDNMEIDFETDSGTALQIVDVDPDTFQVYVKFRLHQFGNDAI